MVQKFWKKWSKCSNPFITAAWEAVPPVPDCRNSPVSSSPQLRYRLKKSSELQLVRLGGPRISVLKLLDRLTTAHRATKWAAKNFTITDAAKNLVKKGKQKITAYVTSNCPELRCGRQEQVMFLILELSPDFRLVQNCRDLEILESFRKHNIVKHLQNQKNQCKIKKWTCYLLSLRAPNSASWPSGFSQSLPWPLADFPPTKILYCQVYIELTGILS